MPSQYIVVLLLGLYSIPYRSITVDEFKSLFHHLGLESLFNSVRISRVFDQINPLSKGHYIVGNKIQLLLVLCPDTFHFIFDIQNEFKKHFFNKKICNKIINRLNNIEKIKYDYKTNNSFPFPSCCDRLKYLLFNITNPYQFDYFLPDYDEEDNNNNNNNNKFPSSSYTDDEDSDYKRSRFRTSSSDNNYTDIFHESSKHRVTFISIIEKFIYILFPNRRVTINSNGFCNKMVSRCKMMGESYSVEKYPKYPSHYSGTSFLSDSGIVLDRQQHIFSGRGNCNNNNNNNNDSNVIGLNGLVISSGRPYSGTLNTITFNYDTALKDETKDDIVTSPLLSPISNENKLRKKTSLISDTNSGLVIMKDTHSSIVGNKHQSEQLGINNQKTNRSYKNSLKVLNNNNIPTTTSSSSTTTTTVNITLSTTEEKNKNVIS